MYKGQHLADRLPDLGSQVVLVEDPRKALADHLHEWGMHDAVVHVSEGQTGRTTWCVTCADMSPADESICDRMLVSPCTGTTHRHPLIEWALVC